MSPPDISEGTVDPLASSTQAVFQHAADRGSRGGLPRLLRLELPADPVVVSVARDRVRQWLTALCWPADQGGDVVLAVSEAMSNAAEHAYRDQAVGLVTMTGGVETVPGGQRRVTVVVRDYGRWRPIPIRHDNRRRGIPIMRACMDTVTIEHSPDDQVGTCVVLRSRVVPPPSPTRGPVVRE